MKAWLDLAWRTGIVFSGGAMMVIAFIDATEGKLDAAASRFTLGVVMFIWEKVERRK